MSDGISAIDIVLEKGLVDQSIANAIGKFVDKWELDVFSALVETSTVSELILRDVLADYFDLPVLDSIESAPCMEKNVMEAMPFALIKKNSWYPMSMPAHGKSLIVVVADPTNRFEFEAIADKIGLMIEVWVAEYSIIQRAIMELYPIEIQLGASSGEK